MNKSLKELYERYDSLQGDNPIDLGWRLNPRINNRDYKEITMSKIVSLLEKFVKDFNLDRETLNRSYTVYFDFNNSLHKTILFVIDIKTANVSKSYYYDCKTKSSIEIDKKQEKELIKYRKDDFRHIANCHAKRYLQKFNLPITEYVEEFSKMRN